MKIRHLLVDAHGCRGPLRDPDRIEAELRAAAEEVGADVRGTCEVRFVPHGVTVVLVLAESHMLVSTWPECELALVEVLLCNPSMEPRDVWARLERFFAPERVELSEVLRGVER